MKKLFIIAAILISFIAVPAFACNDCCGGKPCNPSAEFDGSFEQSTGAFKVDGDYDENKKGEVTLNDGAMAFGGQSSSGEYKAKSSGLGAAAALGGTHVYANDYPNGALAYGITGNITGAGVIGRRGCAEIEGEGALTTVAMTDSRDGWAQAYTSGEFSYEGQTNNGIVLGGGATGGFSGSRVGHNSATAVAGGFTASGVGTFNLCGGGY